MPNHVLLKNRPVAPAFKKRLGCNGGMGDNLLRIHGRLQSIAQGGGNAPALKVFIVCYAAALSADSMARMVMRTMPPKFRISVPCRL